MSYKDLKPGLYIAQGDNIKAIDYTWLTGKRTSGAPSDIETLAARVGWLYVALNARKEKISEIPYQWMLRGNELEDEPLQIHMRYLSQQIDQSLQMFSAAYLHKVYNRIGKLIKLRWLDPATVEPDLDDIDELGIKYYRYGTVKGAQIIIPREQIIDFMIPGLRELEPDKPAGEAVSLPAQVLHGILTTADSIYDNNAIPPVLISVPNLSEPDEKRIQTMFKRFFDPFIKGSRKQRVMTVNKEFTIERMAFSPGDLAMKELSDAQIEVILAANRVPETAVRASAANYATALNDERSFVTTMAGRYQLIADTLNRDPDLQRLDLELVIQKNNHPAMQRDNESTSVALVNYLNAFTPEAAAYLVGIQPEDFPEGITIFKPSEPMVEYLPQSTSEAVEDDPVKADMKLWEKKAIRRLTKGGSLKFESDHIPAALVGSIEGALENAESPEQVRAIFAGALNWRGYP